MKKLLSILLVATMLLCGCRNSVKEKSSEPEWKEVYSDFLTNLYKDSNEADSTKLFYIKDLNGKDAPELIVQEQLKMDVYKLDEKLQKVGSYDFATATTRFLESTNKDYPGIFYYHVGGGLDHYGYVDIYDGELKIEELWTMDYSGATVNLGTGRYRVDEVSIDKDLIKASKEVFSKDNNKDLEFLEITEENIEKINSFQEKDNTKGKDFEFKVEYESYKQDKELMYKYKIYDKSEKLCIEEKDFYKQPNIEEIGNGIIKIEQSAGTGVWWAKYYDSKSNTMSDVYDCPWDEYNNKLIRFENKKLIIQELFNKTLYYKEYNIDTSSAIASTNLAIQDAWFVNDNTIEVTYLIGKDYKEITDRFEY